MAAGRIEGADGRGQAIRRAGHPSPTGSISRRPGGRGFAGVVVIAVVCGALGGCEGENATLARFVPPAGGGVAVGPPTVTVAAGPLPPHEFDVANPYAGDPMAVSTGERLYGWYNCAGCHGSRGGGGMGPPLRDDTWIYGGTPAAIFASIMAGRPQRMPAWRGRLPDEQAWMIVAYIQSMGGEDEGRPDLVPPADRVPAR